MRRVVLVIVKGKDVGRSIVIDMGHCRMFVRSTDLAGETHLVTTTTLRKLEDEDNRLVSRHLKIRAAPEKKGARALLTNFGRDADVPLTDDAVSQNHAMIFVDEAGASLLDMASTNGTFLNGKRVSSTELALGDVVRFGGTRIEIRG